MYWAIGISAVFVIITWHVVMGVIRAHEFLMRQQLEKIKSANAYIAHQSGCIRYIKEEFREVVLRPWSWRAKRNSTPGRVFDSISSRMRSDMLEAGYPVELVEKQFAGGRINV